MTHNDIFKIFHPSVSTFYAQNRDNKNLSKSMKNLYA